VLSLPDLQKLVFLSAEENQVVRYNSTFILSKFSDKRLLSTARSSLLKARQEENANGIYNAILIISFLFDDLEEKQQVDTILFLEKNVPTDKEASWRLLKKVCKKAELSCEPRTT